MDWNNKESDIFFNFPGMWEGGDAMLLWKIHTENILCEFNFK